MAFLYRFFNEKENIIYIGKTKDLKRRMREHFGPSGHLPRECYDSVSEIEYADTGRQCSTEILETYYINKYHPIYNTDKHYLESMQLNEDSIKITELHWQTLYICLDRMPFDVMKNSKPKPRYFSFDLSIREKALSIFHYNINLISTFPGMIKKQIPNDNDVFEFLDAYLKLMVHLSKNTIYCSDILDYSSFDEPISTIEIAYKCDINAYAAIPIHLLDSFNIRDVLFFMKSGLLIYLSKDIYGIPVLDREMLRFIASGQTLLN